MLTDKVEIAFFTSVKFKQSGINDILLCLLCKPKKSVINRSSIIVNRTEFSTFVAKNRKTQF